MPDKTAADILLVEDNPNDVELTRYAFKKSKLTGSMHVVRDGAEALDYLFATGAYDGRTSAALPRLVLLDLKLPKVSGVEVLQRIRSDPRTRRIPVVVLTSSREERDISDAYALNVNSYIVKPVDFTDFCRILGEVGAYWLTLNQAPDTPGGKAC